MARGLSNKKSEVMVIERSIFSEQSLSIEGTPLKFIVIDEFKYIGTEPTSDRKMGQ